MMPVTCNFYVTDFLIQQEKIRLSKIKKLYHLIETICVEFTLFNPF